MKLCSFYLVITTKFQSITNQTSHFLQVIGFIKEFAMTKTGDSFAVKGDTASKLSFFLEAPKSSCNGKGLLALDTYPFGEDLNSQSEAFGAISW